MIGFYGLAAVAEITGCFAFWAWLRLGHSALWIIPGTACLLLFAVLLTRVDSALAGRVFAAYGGIYIVASLLWLTIAERTMPDRWDLIGGAVSLIGALIIIYGPRAGSISG